MSRNWCSEDCLFYETNSCTDCRECGYCGKYLYWEGNRHNIHYDHIVPYSSGGRTIVPVCDDCNRSKHDKGLKEWLIWLLDNRPNKWRKIVYYNRWKKHKIARAVHDIINQYEY